MPWTVISTRGTPAAYAPGAPRVPIRSWLTFDGRHRNDRWKMDRRRVIARLVSACQVGVLLLVVFVFERCWRAPRNAVQRERQAEVDCQFVIERLRQARRDTGEYPSALPQDCILHLKQFKWKTLYDGGGNSCRFDVLIANDFGGGRHWHTWLSQTRKWERD
jgi:hypothetical protein